MKERIKWADRARGLGILLIFSLHFFHIELGGTHLLVQLLSMSCLTAFYFTSGYFCNCRFSCRSWLKHNTFTILLPYFAASLVFWVLHFVQGDPDSFDRFLGIFLQLPNTPWEGGRWFVPSFFVAKLIFDFTASRYEDNFPGLCTFCAGYAAVAWVYTLLDCPRLPWNIEAAFLAQPFFALGLGWKRGMEQRYASLSITKKAWILSAVSVACMVLAALNLSLGGKNMDYHTRELNEIFSAYSASFCAVFLIVQISMMNSKMLEFIGRNSLIYCLYNPLADAVTNRIVAALKWEFWAVRYLVGILGMILLVAPMAMVLKRYFPWAAGKQKVRKCVKSDK